MATKIGYVSRDPSEQINWAEVGANFTGMLKEEARVREEKKAEIDSATREMQRVFDETPMGDSKDLNQWALSYGSEAQKQLLMVNTLLKSGQLKPQDYTVIRQNLADGTDQAFTLLDEYNKEYTDKMERMKSNDPTMSSQKLEQWVMGTVEGFGNFSKSKLMINPQTGKVMVGFINPDTGEVESDPNKLVGVNSLRNRIKSKYDKYDMTAAVTKAKQETFGQFQAIERTIGNARAQGLLKTYNDPTMRSEKTIARLVKEGVITAEQGALYATYDKTEDAWLESQLSQYNTTSLLTDNLRQATGKNYDFTFNPKEQDESTILLKQIDGQVVPDFDNEIGKKQREDAKNGLRTVMRGALDHEVKVQTVNDYTPPSYTPQYILERGDKEKVKQSVIGAWGKLYYGTPAEQISSVNTILGSQNAKDQGMYFIDLKSTPGSVVFKYDGSGSIPSGQRVIPMLDDNKQPIPYRDFVASGNEVHGEDDVDRAMRASGKVTNPKYQPKKSGTAQRTAGKKRLNPIENLNNYVVQNAPSLNNFKNGGGSSLESQLRDAYGILEFKFSEGRFTDVIEVTAPDGESEDFRYDGADQAGQRKAILDYIKAKTPKTTDGDLMKLNSLGSNDDDAAPI